MSKDKGKEAGVYDRRRYRRQRRTWEDAAKRAVETAAKSLRDLRIAEVTKMDLKVEDGKVVAYRTKLGLSFNTRNSLRFGTRSRSLASGRGRADLPAARLPAMVGGHLRPTPADPLCQERARPPDHRYPDQPRK